VEFESKSNADRIIVQKSISLISTEPAILEGLDYFAKPGEYSFSADLELEGMETRVYNFQGMHCRQGVSHRNFCKDCPANTYNFYPTNPAAI